jgi:glycosyltransferase involved in cell wall biosynthesis
MSDALAPATLQFTVFTPTYNRAHTLHRVYDSLCAQTCRDFEWLVVDDGSTDGTADLIAQWAETADFPIRYFRQENSGKHIAHNLAAREARGQFFLPLDSDDACAPRALERIAYHWNAIPAAQRAGFSGIAGLCCDQSGKVIGDRYPADPLDISFRDLYYRLRLRGEKWGAELTEVIRKFPFPEVRGTQFTPEGTVWLAIGKHYKIRCVNEVFRTYYVDDDLTGATLTRRRSLRDSAPGRLYYYVWLLNNDLAYFFCSPRPFLKAAVMLPIVARYSGRSLRSAVVSLESVYAKLLVALMLPVSWVLYVADRLRSASALDRDAL